MRERERERKKDNESGNDKRGEFESEKVLKRVGLKILHFGLVTHR
jgi:hypothetical protein